MRKSTLLLLGYTAGLALAMKTRRDAGKSLLAPQLGDTTISNFLEEIVDIHTSAFGEIHEFISPFFENIQSFDDLKNQTQKIISKVSTSLEDFSADLKEKGLLTKEEALQKLRDAQAYTTNVFQQATQKAITFGDIKAEQIDHWMQETQKQWQEFYEKMKQSIQKMFDDDDSPTKPTSRCARAKKNTSQ